MSIKRCGFPFEIREPKLNAETLSAIRETEQILEEYEKGLRVPKASSSVRELFAAMDAEDEAEETDA